MRFRRKKRIKGRRSFKGRGRRSFKRRSGGARPTRIGIRM